MSSSTPVHTAHPYFRSVDGELCISGVPVSELAARVGRTPFYAYDRNAITRRITELRAALPHGAVSVGLC